MEFNEILKQAKMVSTSTSSSRQRIKEDSFSWTNLDMLNTIIRIGKRYESSISIISRRLSYTG